MKTSMRFILALFFGVVTASRKPRASTPTTSTTKAVETKSDANQAAPTIRPCSEIISVQDTINNLEHFLTTEDRWEVFHHLPDMAPIDRGECLPDANLLAYYLIFNQENAKKLIKEHSICPTRKYVEGMLVTEKIDLNVELQSLLTQHCNIKPTQKTLDEYVAKGMAFSTLFDAIKTLNMKPSQGAINYCFASLNTDFVFSLAQCPDGDGFDMYLKYRYAMPQTFGPPDFPHLERAIMKCCNQLSLQQIMDRNGLVETEEGGLKAIQETA